VAANDVLKALHLRGLTGGDFQLERFRIGGQLAVARAELAPIAFVSCVRVY
jgi:hypothetical protein